MSYATLEDLAEYLAVAEGDLPSDSERLLKRASELVEYAIMGRSGDEETLKLATCAQVENWIQMSESNAIAGGYKQLEIGTFSVEFSDNSTTTMQLAPRTRMYLNKAKLMYRGVRTRAYSRDAYDSDLSN